MKRLVTSLVTGVLGTILVYFVTQTPGRHWSDGIVLLGSVAGSAISGNAHAPNEFVVWVTAFLAITLAALLLLLGIHLATGVSNRARALVRRLRRQPSAPLKH